MKRPNKRWIGLFAVIGVLCLAACFLLRQPTSGKVANVYQDEVCVASIPLDEVEAPYTFTVTDENGHENTISVAPGQICISEANCPDQVCVDTGWIASGLKPIVCLPAKLVIQIEDTSPSEAASFDGVAG